MRVLVRSPGRFSHSILVLAMLQFVFVSNLSVTIGGATKYHVNEMAELQRSMARYRQLLVDDNSMVGLLQVDDKKIEEQVDDDSISEHLETNVDVEVDVGELHTQEVVVDQVDATLKELDRATEKNSEENPIAGHGKTEQQQQGDSESAVKLDSKTEGQQQGDPKSIVESASNTEELGDPNNVVKPESKTEEQQEEQKVEQKTEEATEEPFVFPEPYLLTPTIKDWDEQRGDWLDANPHMRTMPDGKPRVLIVSGSQPNPCSNPVGDNFHIKSLKLKIDYARMHNYEIYYSFAWLDPLFGGFWVKLPLVRNLMLTHPEIEWFFWVDSDAMFTDMLFEAPFDTYEGYNMVMWGWEYGLFSEKSWVAFNAGTFIIRNCQWTLDLFDKWSPMGPSGPVRTEYGKMLSSFLGWRHDNFPADDQSALAYLLITDPAVMSKVKLVDSVDYMLSGFWREVVYTYEDCEENYHPGLGNKRYPWITHFTGCGPCAGGDNPEYSYEECMGTLDRAFNFADNQVLAYMGFQHQNLSSPAVIRTRNETDQPMDFVGVNPWEERIAQVAALAAAEAAKGVSS